MVGSACDSFSREALMRPKDFGEGTAKPVGGQAQTRPGTPPIGREKPIGPERHRV